MGYIFACTGALGDFLTYIAAPNEHMPGRTVIDAPLCCICSECVCTVSHDTLFEVALLRDSGLACHVSCLVQLDDHIVNSHRLYADTRAEAMKVPLVDALPIFIGAQHTYSETFTGILSHVGDFAASVKAANETLLGDEQDLQAQTAQETNEETEDHGAAEGESLRLPPRGSSPGPRKPLHNPTMDHLMEVLAPWVQRDGTTRQECMRWPTLVNPRFGFPTLLTFPPSKGNNHFDCVPSLQAYEDGYQGMHQEISR
jgi:hypothetical protein